MFDEKTIQNLGYYVYVLIDPDNMIPFYIGKGKGNRVFDHLNCSIDLEIESSKYEKIRSINNLNKEVLHLIVRHGLSEKLAYEIEASLIDIFDFLNINSISKIENLQGGHNSIEKGLMTVDEVKRLYNAEKLESIGNNCIVININANYKRGSGKDAIYQATKEIWTIDKNKINNIKFVLSEYKGLIVEVFEVENWYEKERGYNIGAKKFGQTKIGFGFNGIIAPNEIRKEYFNKSIIHLKKRGAAQPIRFNL